MFTGEGFFPVEQQGRHPVGVMLINAPGNPDKGFEVLFTGDFPDFNGAAHTGYQEWPAQSMT